MKLTNKLVSIIYQDKTPNPNISKDKEEALIGILLNYPEQIPLVDNRFFGLEETNALFEDIQKLDTIDKVTLLIGIKQSVLYEYAMTLRSNYDLEHVSVIKKLCLVLEDLRVKRLYELTSSYKLTNISDLGKIRESDEFFNKEIIPIFNEAKSFKDEVFETDAKLRSGELSQGFITGMKPLDAFGKISKEAKVLIAGRPAMGKTTFLIDLVINFIKNNKIPVLINTLEVSKYKIISKLLSNIALINGADIFFNNNGTLDTENYQKALKLLSDMDIEIVAHKNTPQLYQQAVRAVNARRKQEGKEKIGAVFTDFLGLMKSGTDKYLNNTELMSFVAKQIIDISWQEDFIPFNLAQISRAVETRGGSKKPQLSDLKESGTLEELHRLIWLLYRPEAYGVFEDESGKNLRGIGYVVIAKNNDGELGEAEFNINLACNRFYDRETEDDLDSFNNNFKPDKFAIMPRTSEFVDDTPF